MLPDKLQKLMDNRHFDLFAEYAKYEMLSGGPDPHIDLLGGMTKDFSFIDKLWAGGCWISGYNIATAEVFYQNWPWPKVLEEPMLPWILEHWEGLITRIERKSLRVPANMETYFLRYADWMQKVIAGRSVLTQTGLTPIEHYHIVWEETQNDLKFVGRYIGMKLMEYFNRHCGIPLETPDIRPEGAWSPRTMLALLYPDKADWLLGNDTKENIAVTNQVAADFLQILRDDYELDIDMYKLEILLCNFRQAYAGQKTYPGRAHDSEARYYDKLTAYWGIRPTNFWTVRAEVFPNEHLGELNGWQHDRGELKPLARQGLIWSDLIYDYPATTNVLEPVKRRTQDMVKAAEIIPGKLYQSPKFNLLSLEQKVDYLNSLGVDTVLNLWHMPDKELEDNTDVIYLHQYIPDSHIGVDLDWALNLAKILANHIRDGHSILVHCYAGKNRSAFITSLIYRELYQVTGKEAMVHIKSCKPSSFNTNKFFAAILEGLS